MLCYRYNDGRVIFDHILCLCSLDSQHFTFTVFTIFPKYKYMKGKFTFLVVRQILFSCPLGSLVSLWNFETIRGSLMKPKWPKLASLVQKIYTL